MSKKEDKQFEKMEKNAEKPAVLFSFDGAIVETEPAMLATYRHVFALYGKGNEITPDNEQEIVRGNTEEVLRKYLPAKADIRRAVDEFDSYQNNHLIDLIQPMHGCPDLLKWLKKEGYKTGIVSARERSTIVELLRHVDIETYFDVIIGNAGHLEERADAILKACRLMHAKSCVFVTDSAGNISAGTQAGCFTIGIVSHPSRTEALSYAGAGFLTKDYKEIRKLLEGDPMWLAYQLNYPEEVLKKMKKEEKAKKKAEKKERKEKEKEIRKAREKEEKEVEKSLSAKKPEKTLPAARKKPAGKTAEKAKTDTEKPVKKSAKKTKKTE